MKSENGAYKAAVETDAKLVVYKGNRPIWSSKTNGQTNKTNGPFMLQVQCRDNHLVMYDKNEEVIWQSGVYGNSSAPGGYASMQDDGDFVVYNGKDRAIWRSGTAKVKRFKRFGNLPFGNWNPLGKPKKTKGT